MDVKSDDDEDQIDPVMKAYMARVLEQKEKEKEVGCVDCRRFGWVVG